MNKIKNTIIKMPWIIGLLAILLFLVYKIMPRDNQLALSTPFLVVFSVLALTYIILTFKYQYKHFKVVVVSVFFVAMLAYSMLFIIVPVLYGEPETYVPSSNYEPLNNYEEYKVLSDKKGNYSKESNYERYFSMNYDYYSLELIDQVNYDSNLIKMSFENGDSPRFFIFKGEYSGMTSTSYKVSEVSIDMPNAKTFGFVNDRLFGYGDEYTFYASECDKEDKKSGNESCGTTTFYSVILENDSHNLKSFENVYVEAAVFTDDSIVVLDGISQSLIIYDFESDEFINREVAIEYNYSEGDYADTQLNMVVGEYGVSLLGEINNHPGKYAITSYDSKGGTYRNIYSIIVFGGVLWQDGIGNSSNDNFEMHIPTTVDEGIEIIVGNNKMTIERTFNKLYLEKDTSKIVVNSKSDNVSTRFGVVMIGENSLRLRLSSIVVYTFIAMFIFLSVSHLVTRKNGSDIDYEN